jgi:hypothetical protein
VLVVEKGKLIDRLEAEQKRREREREIDASDES